MTTIIIPTYNEKDNIKPIVRAIFDLGLENLRVVIVDDNSPDGTGQLADELTQEHSNLKVIHRPKKKGLGQAYLDVLGRVIRGEILSDFIITMDADFSHPTERIPEIIDKLEGGYDLVVGSRYVKGGSVEGWNFKRRLLSRNANRYARVVTGLSINDLTGGFVGCNVELLRKINLNRIESDGYAFQIEMKYRLAKAGAKFCEVPISFVDRKAGKSKFNKGVVWEAIWVPWRLRFS